MINLSYIIIFILGVVIGGYINECIAQIPKGESGKIPPSQLFKWYQPLSFVTYIPMIQYFYPKSKWRKNFSAASFRYPMVELLSGLLMVLTYHQYGITLQGAAVAIYVSLLVIISFIDLDHMIIPNSLNGIIGITGIIFMLMGWTVSIKQGILGSVIGGGVLLLLGYFSLWFLKKEGMGGGDIKLVAVSGFYLGLDRMIMALILTGYIAGIVLVILLVMRKLNRNQVIPFGPFLSTGMLISILLYENIMQFYWRLIYKL